MLTVSVYQVTMTFTRQDKNKRKKKEEKLYKGHKLTAEGPGSPERFFFFFFLIVCAQDNINLHKIIT